MLEKEEYLAKGKRSVVYKGFFKGKEAVLKVANKDSPLGIMRNEANWLKRLEKYDISPRLYKAGEDYIICEFVKGKRIIDWIIEHDQKEIKKVLKKVLMQCRILDKLKVNKKELQRPVKHIIIGKTVKMIDFERCKETNNPKNVTQFCQFLTSKNMKTILDDKKILINKDELLPLLQNYKKEQTEKNFKKILNCILKQGTCL